VQQIRPGGSAVLDQLFTGCAVKGWKLAIKQGPGRLSAVVTEDLVHSGLYTTPSAVTMPAPHYLSSDLARNAVAEPHIDD
jgi:hypothetical protein